MCLCRHFNSFGVLEVLAVILLLLFFEMSERCAVQWTMMVVQEIQKCQRKSYSREQKLTNEQHNIYQSATKYQDSKIAKSVVLISVLASWKSHSLSCKENYRL